jgi:hypothetical protein
MNSELDPKLAENEKPTIKLELTVDEVNIVMAALQELPHRIADPLLRKIVQQGQSQLGQ